MTNYPLTPRLCNFFLKTFLIIFFATTHAKAQQQLLSSPATPDKLSSAITSNGASMQIRLDEDKIVTVSPYVMQHFDERITSYYEQLLLAGKDPLTTALNFFLESPYLFEALGEGPQGTYSQEPLYRTDRFDCVTYVDTVLSLIHSKNLDAFKKNIISIRYQGDIKYRNRTDWFTDLEWLPRVHQLGWVKDITTTILDRNNKPIALTAKTIIDKPNWYKVKPLKAMHFLPPLPDQKQAQALLEKLRNKQKDYQALPSNLTYLPLSKLFISGKPVTTFFDQIPSGSVIIIVRPNWPIRDQFPGYPEGYGTNLNVSHLGIAIRNESDLIFYHASSLEHKVVSEPLVNYLQKYLDNTTVQGIHVEKIA